MTRWQPTVLSEVILEARPGFACGKDVAEGVFQFRMNNITTDGQLALSKKRRVPGDTRNLGSFLVEPGDVLFNATNSPDLVGKAAYFPGLDEPAVFSNHFLRLRPHPDRLEGRFLARWLNLQFQRGVFKGMCRQWVNQATVGRDSLLAMQLPLPAIHEQRRIADILHKAEALRAKRRSAIAQLDALTQAIFLEMFGDPVGSQLGWKIQTIEAVATSDRHSIVDGPFGSSIKPEDYRPSGVPVIRIANITKGGYFSRENLLFIEKRQFEALRRSSIAGDDVLVSRVGTLGNTCIFPQGFGDALLSTTGVCKITLDKNRMLPVFLHVALRLPSFQRQIERSASTSVQKYFNLSSLRNWRIIVPPVSLQCEFAQRVAVVEKLKAAHRASLAEMDALFASLQYRAFRGDL